MALIYSWDSQIKLHKGGTRRYSNNNIDSEARFHNLDDVSKKIYEELAAIESQIGGGGSTVLTYTKVFTPEEIYDLIAGSYEVIAAPGVGKAIKIIDVLYELKYNTTSYNGGEGASIIIHSAGGTAGIPFTISSITDNKILVTNTTTTGKVLFENNNLELLQSGLTDDDAGDSDIRITIQYEIIDVLNF